MTVRRQICLACIHLDEDPLGLVCRRDGQPHGWSDVCRFWQAATPETWGAGFGKGIGAPITTDAKSQNETKPRVYAP
jgi:hypothetical protein